MAEPLLPDDLNTGRDPTNRGKLGNKRHLATDRTGTPLAVVTSGANRHPTPLIGLWELHRILRPGTLLLAGMVAPNRRPGTGFRESLRRIYGWFLRRTSTGFPDQELTRPVIVFAPHPDDESLGCGGLILRKRSHDAPVTVVLMTDGSRSPGKHGDDIVRQRQDEFCEALARLRVDREDAVFLGFPDGDLARHHAAVVEAVRNVLAERPAAEVVVPYRFDDHSDHVATYRAVREALERCSWVGEMYEYTVWFWYHWPWVRIAMPRRLDLLGVVGRSFLSTLRALFQLRTALPLDGLLEQKRAAFDCHRSQASIADISNGEFLATLFRDREYYRRTAIGSATRNTAG